MIVKIGEHDPIELRFTFNSFIEFEKKFGEAISVENLNLDKTLWFYYFIVLCSKRGWQTTAWLDKDEFDEWLNDDPNNITLLSEFVSKNMDLNNILTEGNKKK